MEAKAKITPFDIAVFTRQMATMMKAGVPLVQSFDIVADGLEHPTLRELVVTIKYDVAAGNSFAGALAKHPRYFDDLFCNLIESGEKSGALETMLERVATYMEKPRSSRKSQEGDDLPHCSSQCSVYRDRHFARQSCATVSGGV